MTPTDPANPQNFPTIRVDAKGESLIFFSYKTGELYAYNEEAGWAEGKQPVMDSVVKEAISKQRGGRS